MNEKMQIIWEILQTNKIDMSLVERCDLQKRLKEILEYDLSDKDREAFEYHAKTFEDDMMIISSRLRDGIFDEMSKIQIALNRMQVKLQVGCKE